VILLFVRKHFTFISSSHWWVSPEFGTFKRGQITSELGQPPEVCVLPNCYPVRATFDILKVSIAFSPSLKQSLIQLRCALKTAISRYAKIAA
jgi:hypothetical protein